MEREAVARRLVTVSAVLLVAVIALGARLLAVNVLPIDFDEDDYLRAGQLYSVGLQEGDPGVLLRENYRTEHPQLSKLVTGVSLVPLPAAPEIPDRPTTADPSSDLPEPHLTVARTVNGVIGAATAVLLAVISPIGGFWLAVHTWSIKYSSQVMLESVPAFFALLSVVLASLAWRAPTPGRRRAWLVAAAVGFGLACAGKYLYGVAGLAIVADWLWRTRGTALGDEGRPGVAGLARWGLPVIGWLGLGFVVFLAVNPYLWADPVGRLWASIAYHGGYATSEAVQDTGWPSWQPLVWLMGSVPFHERGTFVLTLDLLVAALAIIGLPGLWRRHRIFALWLGIGLLFLLAWPTKWPQYVLIVSAPLSLAAGVGTVVALRPVIARLRAAGRRVSRRSSLSADGPGLGAGPATQGRGARRGLADLRRASPWLLPGLVAFAVLAVIPVAYQFLMSLTDMRLKSLRDGLQGGITREAVGGLTGQIPAVPFDIDKAQGTVQYVGIDLLNSAQQGIWLGDNTSAAFIAFSVLWMVVSVGLQAALGIGVALVLERPGVRYAAVWRTLFILPWAIPEVVGAIAWRDIVHPEQGLVAQAIGGVFPWPGSPELSLLVLLLAGTWMGWPLWMLVATAGLRTIPRSVQEAAALDGAGRWRGFAWITLPMLLPLLGAAFVVRGIAAFNQFYLFYVLETPSSTTTLATFSFYVFNMTSGPGLFTVSAAFNIMTIVALAVVVAWFLRWRSRAERVALV